MTGSTGDVTSMQYPAFRQENLDIPGKHTHEKLIMKYKLLPQCPKTNQNQIQTYSSHVGISHIHNLGKAPYKKKIPKIGTQ